MRTPVALEVGTKRCFATALEWPGWCRSGRTEEAALENLVAHGARYAAVVAALATKFEPPVSADRLDVVERLPGSSSTEFGAPGRPPSADAASVRGAELARLEAILQACWTAFDEAAAGARGITLARGPRGGGRSLEAIVKHVTEAEGAYIRRLGARVAPDAQLAAVHQNFIGALEARARGSVPDTGPRGGKRWSARFAVRYAAWHALDHAWEIEDRARA